MVSSITDSCFLARDPLRAMVGNVIARSPLPLCALGLVFGGCKHNDEPFLPLPSLCPQRTEAICAERSYACGDGEPDLSCPEEELASCNALTKAFKDEPGLTYDSRTGSLVRSDEQAALDHDEAPFPLARYFSGGRPVDAECERDSQCETGSCSADTGLCQDAPALQLCEPE